MFVSQRDCSHSKLQFKILAPYHSDVPASFRNASVDARRHSNLLFDVQVLRGNVYREQAPMISHLSTDGRHVQAVDPHSWHILVMDQNHVLGCARYRPINGGFEQLGASTSALATSRKYGPVLRRAVETQMARVRGQNLHYGEAGGWALRPELRCSTAGVNIALISFLLAHHAGGGITITTATNRHHSASILRRIGARRLAELPAYFEPVYGSVIEILYFDTGNLDSPFAAKMDRLRKQFDNIEVICQETREKPLQIPTVYTPEVYIRDRTGQTVSVN